MAWRDTYLRWKAEGRCVWCGSKKVVTKLHCKKHRSVHNRQTRESKARTGSAVTRKRDLKRRGLCCVCMRPRVNASHCEDCRVRHNEHVRKYQRSRG